MNSRTSLGRFALMLVTLVGLTACERDLTGLDPAPFPNDALVFGDAPGPGLDWFFTFDTSIQEPFPFQFEEEETFRGEGAVRIEVPGPGQFVGGVYITSVPRDLSGYNALTFWAKASTNITMNEVGFGLDFEADAYRTGVVGGVPLTTAWKKVIVPIPDPAKLTREKGMFWMAEGTETGGAYDIFIDEMQWERVSTFANSRPAIGSQTIRGVLGDALSSPGGTLTVDVAGSDVTVAAAPAFFEYSSSDPSVVAVTEEGIQYVGQGTATITATLGGRPAAGEITINVVGPPEVAAPTPDQPADEVVSLYSDAYDDVTVDTWSAVWDNADVEDVVIAGDNVKKYTNLTFAGIEFGSAPVDASDKGFIHLDVYAAEPSLQLKFVDFGADGAFGGGDDSEAIIQFDGSSITPDTWSSLDIPFSELGGLAARGALAQVVVEGTSPTLYIDNFYFYGEPEMTEPAVPEVAAPTPTQAPGAVISMFSNAYDDVVVDTWSASWDQALVEDVQIAGDDTKKYSGLTFAGIEATSQPIDASGMTHFRMDFWTPDDMSAGDAFFQVRLVDFGADGAFAGGDDTAANLVINATSSPAIASGSWVSIDVPLTAFAGMNTGAIAQMVIEGTPNTIYIDNVYFYNADFVAPTEPQGAAPTPSYAAADVISLFSDAYTDVTVDTWSTTWDQADVTDVTIAGNAAKKYTSGTVIGIETASAQIDATSMTHFRIDVWTAETTASSEFKLKLVSFGDDGGFGGGDDVEHELIYNATTTPAVQGGTWITFDIPLSQFTGLTQTANMAQYIIAGNLGELWVDNMLFHN